MLSLKDKTSVVLEWAQAWEGFDGYLKLNAVVTKDGEATLVTEVTDIALQRFIDGSADRQYVFSLRLVLPWSSGYDSTNDDSLAYAVKLYDWLVEQNAAKRWPEWEGATITELLPTHGMPQLNAVYKEDGLADYIIQCIINYAE